MTHYRELEFGIPNDTDALFTERSREIDVFTTNSTGISKSTTY